MLMQGEGLARVRHSSPLISCPYVLWRRRAAPINHRAQKSMNHGAASEVGPSQLIPFLYLTVHFTSINPAADMT